MPDQNIRGLLQESEGRFRLLADQSPFLIWVTNEEGGLECVNSTYLEFFGLTLEDVQGLVWVKRSGTPTPRGESPFVRMRRQPSACGRYISSRNCRTVASVSGSLPASSSSRGRAVASGAGSSRSGRSARRASRSASRRSRAAAARVRPTDYRDHREDDAHHDHQPAFRPAAVHVAVSHHLRLRLSS